MGECILVIGTIAHVVVYKHIRIQQLKQLVKGRGVAGVAFDKIPIQVKVSSITSESVFFRAVLICSAVGVAIKCTSNIVNRNNRDYKVLRHLDLSLCQVSHKHHTGIYTVTFSRVDPIVDQDHGLFAVQA